MPPLDFVKINAAKKTVINTIFIIVLFFIGIIQHKIGTIYEAITFDKAIGMFIYSLYDKSKNGTPIKVKVQKT